MSTFAVVHYSAAWPEAFRSVELELHTAFGLASVAVEHIGSTAVPSLAAKPVIDVLLGAQSLAEVEQRVEALAALGYEYRPAYEHHIPERRYFVKAQPGELRVHLHAVKRSSRLWNEHLMFRNALRESRHLREEYQELKFRLAKEHSSNKELYTAAKAPFIQSVLAQHLRDVA
jgi:GrpB-like predicted nucleotidyltransferase (UPF0157 family)